MIKLNDDIKAALHQYILDGAGHRLLPETPNLLELVKDDESRAALNAEIPNTVGKFSAPSITFIYQELECWCRQVFDYAVDKTTKKYPKPLKTHLKMWFPELLEEFVAATKPAFDKIKKGIDG